VTERSTRPIEIGDVVVTRGGVGGPAMRVVAFSYVSQGSCVGPTAKLESLRRDAKDPTKAAWTAEFLISRLRILPEGHYARRSPFYDFDVNGAVDGRTAHSPLASETPGIQAL
jgi:hypothetical protein